MKITVLDDYVDVVRTLACFENLRAHYVEIWNDHVSDTATLVARRHIPQEMARLKGGQWQSRVGMGLRA